MQGIHPVARTEGILTEQVEDELVVYDESRDMAARLNRTAALVWQNCDGSRSVDDLAALLREEVTDAADADLVMVTLDGLQEHGLIESGYAEREVDESKLSRRRFMRRVGIAGAAAAALPLVQSIVAPSPAAAQSGDFSDSSYYYSDARLKRNIRALGSGG